MCGEDLEAPENQRDTLVKCPKCEKHVYVLKRSDPAIVVPQRGGEHYPGCNGRHIICPNVNCGYQGPSEVKSEGSSCLAIILLLIMILPGVLYLLFGFKDRYYCPKCGLQIGEGR